MISIVILSVLFIFLSQTKVFRSWFYNFALNVVNEQLIGKVEIADIKINPFKGIQIWGLRVLAADDTLLSVPKININYAFDFLFDKTLYLKSVDFYEPSIKLIRNPKDSTWNFEHLVKSSEDTTERSKIDWLLYLEKFNLSNANVFISDKLSIMDNKITFSPTNTVFHRLNLVLSAKAQPALDKYSVQVQRLDFYELSSELDLTSGKFKIQADRDSIVIDEMAISSNCLDAKMNSAIYTNLFDENNAKIDFEKTRFYLDFDADKIQLKALNKFIPDFPNLSEKLALKLKLHGKIDALSISELSLKTGNTVFNAYGNINSINDELSRNYRLVCDNSVFFQSDLNGAFEALGINDFSLDNVWLDKLNLNGNSNNISADFKVRSSLGNVTGRADLNLTERVSFNGNVKFSNIRLANVIGDKSMNSDLTGILLIKGSGNDIKNTVGNINLLLEDSYFNEFDISKLELSAEMKSGAKLTIDTLALMLKNVYSDSLISSFSSHSNISMKGDVVFTDISNPKYDLTIEMREFNLASLTKFGMAPQYLDAVTSITGTGLHPDSIEIIMHSEVIACIFGNKSLMPFDIDLTVERFGETGRLVLLNSELFNLQLVGEYQLADFINLANYQIHDLVTFINRQVFSFTYNDPDSLANTFRYIKRESFKPYTMDLKAELKDLTPIGIAVRQPYLSGNANIELYVDVEPSKTVINLTKLDVNYFQYKDGLSHIAVNPSNIKAEINVDYSDSVASFEKIAMTFDALTDTYINELVFEKPKIEFVYQDSILNLSIDSRFNKLLNINTVGSLYLHPGEFSLMLDTTVLSLNENFSWHSIEPVVLNLNSEGLNFKKFKFERYDLETIDLSGLINPETAHGIKLEVRNFPIAESGNFLPAEQKALIDKLSGEINYLVLHLDGLLAEPIINLKFNTNDLFFDYRYLGKLNGSSDYNFGLLKGNAVLKDFSDKKVLFSLDVNSLPIDLSLKIGGQRITDKSVIDIVAKAYDFPIEIVNPLVPDVIRDLKGNANGTLNIKGVKNNVNYTGRIDANKTRFLMSVNNMYYNVEGSIIIDDENLSFEQLRLSNDVSDYKSGISNISGGLVFRNFNIEKFDINIQTNGIMLLSNKSIKTMPDLYGDFIISTGNKPVRFFGTFAEPYLTGDVNILRSKIYMPASENKKHIAKTAFKYEVRGNNLTVENLNQDSLLMVLFDSAKRDSDITEKKVTTDIAAAPNFADILNYDLYVWFVNPMELYMQMPLGEVFAIVSTKVPTSPIHYIVNPKKKEAIVIGDLVLKQNSTFKYIKLFNLTGEITFPTGRMENPKIDLKAEYNGRTTLNNLLRTFTVNLYIKGSVDNPELTFDYSIDNEQGRGDSTRLREDALFLLMFGLTKAEFESPNSGGTGGTASDLVNQSVAAMISRSVTEMLSGTGFISSADIDLQGGSFQNAKLKLSGQIMGMTWNVGGNIADVMSGYEFTAEVPLGLLLFPDDFRSLFLQFTTSVNPSQNITRNQKNWEIKLKFGDEF